MINAALKVATNEQIREALEAADPMALLGLLYHATRDDSLKAIETRDVPAGFSEIRVVAHAADAEMLRRKAYDLLVGYRDGTIDLPVDFSRAHMLAAMSLAAGGPVPDEEYELHYGTLALDNVPHGWGKPPVEGKPEDLHVIVIGTGFAGINAAVQLKASGISFEVLEKNAGVGGTWYNNRYPGARVDWPSRLYSHSFGIEYSFQHPFAPRGETEDYMNWCVDRFDLRGHIRLETMVTKLRWDNDAGLWHVTTREPDGSLRIRKAHAVISAIGLLERPHIPQFEGLASFKGITMHTSRFDPSLDLSDKRVVVIGTGASGMQMVPDLAPLAKHVTVFQRTPSWSLPAPGYRDPWPAGGIWLSKNMPYYANWVRFVSAWNLGDHRLFKVFEVDPDWQDTHSVNETNHRVREHLLAFIRQKLGHRPELMEKCTPDYPPFANRPVVDNGWYDSLLRDDVRLVTDGIDRFTAEGVITDTGELIPADALLFATGFRPNDYFAEIEIEGRDGLSVKSLWSKDGPRAYWGVTVPHLPNFFMLYGPNSNPRNLGPVQYGEWAVLYILRILKMMVEQGWKSVEVTDAAYNAFNDRLDAECLKLVSVNPRTRKESYYVNSFGRSAVQSPWASAIVMEAFSDFKPEDYTVQTC